MCSPPVSHRRRLGSVRMSCSHTGVGTARNDEMKDTATDRPRQRLVQFRRATSLLSSVAPRLLKGARVMPIPQGSQAGVAQKSKGVSVIRRQ